MANPEISPGILESPKKRIEALSKQLDSKPDRAALLALLEERSELYYDIGNFDAARADYDRIITIDASQPFAHYGLARLRCRASTKDGLKAVETALQRFPVYAPLELLNAELLLESRKFDPAIVLATNAVSHCGDRRVLASGALTVRARAYLEKEQYEKALKDVGEALEIEPIAAHNPADRYLLRASINLSLKAYDRGVADYEAAIRLGGDLLEAKVGLWCAYSAKGCFRLALRVALALLEKYPAKADAVLMVARTRNRLGEYRESKELLEEHLDRLDTNRAVPTQLFYELAMAYECLEEFEYAVETYDLILEQRPDDSRSLLAKARLLLCCPDEELRDAKTGLALAKKATTVAKDGGGPAGVVYALALAANGEYDEAVKIAEKSLKAPDLSEDYVREVKKAISHFKERRPYRSSFPFTMTGISVSSK